MINDPTPRPTHPLLDCNVDLNLREQEAKPVPGGWVKSPTAAERKRGVWPSASRGRHEGGRAGRTFGRRRTIGLLSRLWSTCGTLLTCASFWTVPCFWLMMHGFCSASQCRCTWAQTPTNNCALCTYIVSEYLAICPTSLDPYNHPNTLVKLSIASRTRLNILTPQDPPSTC